MGLLVPYAREAVTQGWRKVVFVAAKVMLKKWGKPVLGTRSDRINIHNGLHDYLYFEDYPGCLWFAVGW